jgi:hypothetical protein
MYLCWSLLSQKNQTLKNDWEENFENSSAAVNSLENYGPVNSLSVKNVNQ